MEEGKISNKQARLIFDKMVETDIDPITLVNELGFIQISDVEELTKMINELLDMNPQLVEEYKNGKDRVIDFFVGQIMKKTEGKANPSLTREILIKEIKRR